MRQPQAMLGADGDRYQADRRQQLGNARHASDSRFDTRYRETGKSARRQKRNGVIPKSAGRLTLRSAATQGTTRTCGGAGESAFADSLRKQAQCVRMV
jgi:hypothetical protein